MLSKVALVPAFSVALAGSLAMAGPITPPSHTYIVALSGDAEVISGTDGDMDGSGKVKLTLDTQRNQVCYDFSVSKLATPLMAHIHKGSKFVSGPSVVTLLTGPGADLHNCVPWTEKCLTRIVADPANFYVNLYTTEYPDGALRGQLA